MASYSTSFYRAVKIDRQETHDEYLSLLDRDPMRNYPIILGDANSVLQLVPAMRFCLFRLPVFLLVISIASCSEQTQPSAEQAATTSKTTRPPSADDIVRQLAAFYANAKSVQVDSRQITRLSMDDVELSLPLKQTFVIEKPNRVVVRSSGPLELGLFRNDQMELDLISNGETLVTYYPILKTYTEADAPNSYRDLVQDSMLLELSGGGIGVFALRLVADDPYTALMEDVTAKEYVGTEQLNGFNTHHLKFTQDQFDWEMWIQADGAPFVLKVITDMSKSKSAKQLRDGFAADEISIIVTIEFSNWKMNQTLGAETFTFHAPEGVSKVDNFSEDLGADEPSPN